MPSAHPQLVEARLDQLHPTQITVGKNEVARKRSEWRALRKNDRDRALNSHWFPAVCGPQGRHYIVDHHHFGLALLEEGYEHGWLMIVKDLSWLEPAIFWSVMDFHQWAHPYNRNGQRQDFSSIPAQIIDLEDDAYRSIAGDVRRSGGFAKDAAPFSEFLWADFFRSQISPAAIGKNYDKAIAKATKLARSPDARYLPGWTGVNDAS